MLFRKLVSLGVIVALGCFVTGCGRPLYKANSLNCAAQEEMGRICVDIIPDREGQILRNFLNDRISKYPQTGDKCYNLKVQYKIARTELGIRTDETSSRANLTLTGNFTLTDQAKSQTIFQGKFFSIASYLVDDAPFVTRHSEQKATEQTLNIAAHDIEQQLYVFFERSHETNASSN